MKRLLLATCLLGLALASTRADWATRERRPAETASMNRFFTTVVGAMPAGPEGWRVTERTDTVTGGSITEGAEESPLRWEYTMRYENRDALDTAGERTLAALSGMPQRSSGARYQELIEENTRLATMIGEAATRGDMAAVERLAERSDEIAREINEIASSDRSAGDRIIAAQAAQDARLEVTVMANEEHCAPGEPIEVEPPVAGLRAWRAGDPGRMIQDQWQEGVTVVLLGPWRAPRDEPGVFRAAFDARRPYPELQTVMVRVRGARARARAFLERIDWARIKGLIESR
jgi:hypothetical protein